MLLADKRNSCLYRGVHAPPAVSQVRFGCEPDRRRLGRDASGGLRTLPAGYRSLRGLTNAGSAFSRLTSRFSLSVSFGSFFAFPPRGAFPDM